MPSPEEPVQVSVLTPSFGYGRFIADAIESVLGQTGVTLEHVIQDGGSTDETLAVLRSFDPRVVWESTADAGQSDALNKALEKARGTWVAWLNADEFYLPGGIAALVEHGEATGADVVYGDNVSVDADGRLLRLEPQHRFTARVLRDYGPFIPSCSVIFKRASLSPDPWDVALRRVMDWDLYLGMLQRGTRFAYLPYPVSAFRVHADQVTARPGSGEVLDVRARYGIEGGPRSHRLGRILHAVAKSLSGSVIRQVKARSLKGADMRWFGRATGGCDDLLERSYAKRRMTGPTA